jgi:radical SAM superfamily enzyme YgiQ (UPF0313 family)
MARMNEPRFRPPAEAHSLILQVDRGCPYNRCTFCRMYRDVTYRRLPMDEVEVLIRDAARDDPEARRVFLADGDVMRRPFAELHQILTLLNTHLPRLARVSVYANGSSIAAKTDAELKTLRSLRLHTLYLGMESGDEDVLTMCRKGETAAQMVAAGIRAEAAGLRMSVMVLLGLGGAAGSVAHARHTAAALNRMQPRLVSALRVTPIPGTELHDAVDAGTFQLLTEQQVIGELRELIAALDLDRTVFRANHSSNIVPVEARLPRDKSAVLRELDALLASGALDAQSPGPMSLWL